VPTLTDNPLVRGVARISIPVERKLLIAFALVVALLVAVGALGVGVLSQSNSRVEALNQLPERAAAYQQLYNESDQLNQALGDRSGVISNCFQRKEVLFCSQNSETGDTGIGNTEILFIDDGAIGATIGTMEPVTDVNNVVDLGFDPPANERAILTQVHTEYVAIATGMTTLKIEDESGGPYADNITEIYAARKIEAQALQLISITSTAGTSLVAQNDASYLGSQHLFIGVAVASALLALLLALILSRALTGPIRRIDSRLAAIASGDFSGHVDVPNRDELGALAVNLNRMNDELGRLYRELETASRHKSEFLANMSHELRTPLNAVIGFSDVLRDQMFGELNAKQMEYVDDIHTSGRHLLTLINDILDMSKIEAGRMDLQVSSFSLPEVLRNSVALLRERATRQGIALSLEVDPGIDIIEADERLLKQVIFNLLSNALNFTERGGHVEVAARDQGDQVAISVRDDGVGIAPDDQARIFLEFEQAGKSTVQEGTGLGLALSRRFVELHGGRLTVDSAPGAGSTFTFTLPKLAPSPAAAQADGASQSEAPQASIAAVAPS
jgi:signal transduction histidine kinase